MHPLETLQQCVRQNVLSQDTHHTYSLAHMTFPSDQIDANRL